jgi:predicted metal-dependent phosphoesterase TrpH
MKMARLISGFLILAGLVTGTASDTARKNPVLMLGGYRVLAADFHVHSFPLSWATLGPWDTVVEAQRQGLDAIAMTGHNNVWVGKVGRWFSEATHGPMILVGEEIVTPKYHLLAVGIENAVSWRQPATSAVSEIHRQGGVAIAAHPLMMYWPALNDAMHELDGTEVLHPIAYGHDDVYRELRDFYGRAGVTAIGDSDYHGLGAMGVCRTYVFARDNSPGAILEAVRTRHTVVYDRDGRAYGDPQLLHLIELSGRFDELPRPASNEGWLIRLSYTSGILGLLGAFLFGFGKQGDGESIRKTRR